MENPGAVCISENVLYWKNSSKHRKTSFCLTFIHELSHMWLGDLVTMKWWDDIWLNESFAVFISHYCLENLRKDNFDFYESFSFDSNVKFFFYKLPGYDEDSIEDNTHPVCQNIENSEESTEIFDSITYCKGAAVLKQLFYIIGPSQFSESMKIYFKTFRWLNSDMNDFFNIIQKVLTKNKMEFDIEEWKLDWILKPSLNILEIEKIYMKNEMLAMNIIQKPFHKKYKFERHHFFNATIFYFEKNSIERNEKNIKKKLCKVSIFKDKDKFSQDFISKNEILVNLEENVIFEKNGFSNDFLGGILLNSEDHGYFKYCFDKISFNFFRQNFFYIESDLNKSVILLTFYTMVTFGEFSPLKFLDEIALKIIQKKTIDIQLLNQTINLSYGIIDNFLPINLSKINASLIFYEMKILLLDLVKKEDKNEERITFLTDNLGFFAKTNENILELSNWILNQNEELFLIKKTSSLLTSAIELIFFTKIVGEKERIHIMKSYVQNHRYYKKFCLTTMEDEEEKNKLWEDIFLNKNQEMSVTLIGFIMKAFNNPFQIDSYYDQAFFDSVLTVFKNFNREYSKVFFTRLYPKTDKVDFLINNIENLKTKIKNLNMPTLNYLLNEKLSLALERKMIFEKYNFFV